MKIKSIRRVNLDHKVDVYDVINSLPYHNFLIKTNTSSIISHNCALMDEVSFAPGQSISYESSKIMSTYTNLRRRMESRFMVEGHMYGLMFLVSSKATESSFLESYIADQLKKNYPIYVVDQPLWKIKPQAYSGKFFKLAVGNKYVKSKIVEDQLDDQSDEDYSAMLDSLVVQGYRILDVPIEHRQAFDQDMDKALQDIAGISTSMVTKPFNYQRIVEMIKPIHNPFRTDIIVVGTNDDLQYKDFFDATKIPTEVLGAPVFLHLDASVSDDKTGLAAVAIIGSKVVQKITSDIDVIESVDELVYQTVFTVAIQAPKDSQISFEKTRQFIYYLKDEVGLNIKHISTDNFQSYDTRQILASKGFDVGYTSLDRTPYGYDGLRMAINEKRLYLLEGCQNVINELTEIEKDNVTHKWDHPVGGCLPGYQQVITNKGKKCISDLNEEEYKVLSYDAESNKYVYTKFTNLRITKRVNIIYQITTNDGRFECTDNHPILMVDGTYVRADELCVGDVLTSYHHKSQLYDYYVVSNTEVVSNSIVLKIEKKEYKYEIPVYDIEVPKYSNFVLDIGVVVHNSKDTSDALAGAYYDASNYKDEYLFYHPSEFNYEELNDNSSDLEKMQEQFKNDFIRSEINNAINSVKNKSSNKQSNNLPKTINSNKDSYEKFLDSLVDDNILFL